MDEKVVNVECYAGYKGDERPVRLQIGRQWVEVVEIEDRWYSPGVTYFRVLVTGGDGYVLRRDDAQDVWSFAGYRGRTGATLD
jgi:hypothetical protein